jgi:hypothetical protein
VKPTTKGTSTNKGIGHSDLTDRPQHGEQLVEREHDRHAVRRVLSAGNQPLVRDGYVRVVTRGHAWTRQTREWGARVACRRRVRELHCKNDNPHANRQIQSLQPTQSGSLNQTDLTHDEAPHVPQKRLDRGGAGGPRSRGGGIRGGPRALHPDQFVL